MAFADEEVEDHAEDREEENEKDPEEFIGVRSAAFDDVDDRDDVEDKNKEADDSAHSTNTSMM